MTIKAPAHAQRFVLGDNFHLVDPAVTTSTANSGVQMQAVIKIGVAGQFVNPDPFNRSSGGDTLADQVKFIAIHPDQGVTVHTYLCWWDTGHSRSFNKNVAVAAIDAQITGMELVAVCDRLVWPVADVGILRRAKEPDSAYHRTAPSDDYYR